MLKENVKVTAGVIAPINGLLISTHVVPVIVPTTVVPPVNDADPLITQPGCTLTTPSRYSIELVAVLVAVVCADTGLGSLVIS